MLAFLCLCARAPAATGDLKFDHVLDLGGEGAQTFLQDREGFLWFGAKGAGMARYDGYELKRYGAGKNGLSNGYVYSIIQDPEAPDIFWIGTKDGLNRFDRNAGTFQYYKHDPENPRSISFSSINYMAQDSVAPHILWIATDGGLNKFDKRTGTAVRYRHDPGNPRGIGNNNVWRVIEDRADPHLLWIGTWGGGLFRFDKETETFTGFVHDPDDPRGFGHENNIVSFLAQDRDDPDVIWVGAFNGLDRFHKKTGTFTHYRHDPADPDGIPGGLVAMILDDGRGRLWLGGWIADNGLTVFDKASGTFSNYRRDPVDPRSPAGDHVVNISRDRSGLFWITYMSGKVDKYDPWNQNFTMYRRIPGAENSLSDDLITTIFEDRRGTVWVGTQSGLNRFNEATGAFTRFTHDPDDPASLDKNYISSLFEDAEGRFWLTFYPGNVLAEFDRDAGKIISRHAAPGADIITKIIGDPDDPDILWLGLRPLGFGKFHKPSASFTFYPPDPEHPDKGVSYGFMYEVRHDAFDPLIWIGGWEGSGLNRFDKAAGGFKQYVASGDDPDAVSSNAIAAMYQNGPEYLWIGTLGGGLNRFHKPSETFVAYAEEHGVPPNVNGILEDGAGRLWLAANQGLVVFNPDAERVEKRFRQSDGLQGDVFFRGSAMKTADGRMWFGGVNGLNAFYPDRIKENPHAPPVVLTAFRQGGDPLFSGKAPENVTDVVLDWRQNFFEFEYAALSFTRPENNQYAYMLAGLDKDWYFAGHRRFGRYSGIPPGRYTLRIKGSNNDGVWNDDGVAVRITVPPPFWKTWWFFLLCMAGFLGVASVMTLSKIRQLRAEKAAVEERVEHLHFLQELIDSVPNPIYYKDLDGVYLGCNKAFEAFFGRKKEEIVGRKVHDLLPETEANRLRQKDADLFQHPGLQVYEASVNDAEGNLRHMIVNKVAFSRKDGKTAGLLGVATDVTEQKKFETRMRQSQKMDAIGTLAGGIAHDFNNILSAIIGYSELSLDATLSQEQTKKNLGEILKAGNRARELVRQILAFSRQAESELKPVQVSLIVKEALKLLRASLPSTIDIRRRIQSNASALADPVQIHQIIMNLCTNAAHAMAENGGFLDISLEDADLDELFTSRHPDTSPGPHLKLSVGDSGTGVPPEIRERIFDPFFTTRIQNQGTGLGLAVVHGIVRQLGGAISVYSETGKGATFSVFLPAIEAADAPSAAADAPLPRGSERILFVDDEPAVADTSKMILESLGYHVEIRTDSAGALDIFKARPNDFDLVITDMTMPKLTGDRLAEAVMAVRPDIPVILCTGFSATMDDGKAKALGVRAFVKKPMLKAEIARLIRQALDNPG